MPLTNEDKVIIFSVALGLLGSVSLFYLAAPPIIISIFLAMGVSALVYRFLGGIKPDTTITVKTITISGTLAALVGVAVIIHIFLVKEVAVDINDLFQPSVKTWTAIANESYSPLELKITKIKPKGENPIKPDKNIFLNRGLKIKLNNGDYSISPQENFDFILGNLRKADIASLNFFNRVALKRFFLTRRLQANTQNIRVYNFPFVFSTTTYDDGVSGYLLTAEDGNVIHSGSLSLGQGEIVCLNNTFYLIAVIEANHTSTNETQIFSKFTIIQLETSVI